MCAISFIAALEASLGSFYAPLRPLSYVIVVDYRDPISRLARRFFHHLLRYQRFEKAFLLAVDLHSRDLFMVKQKGLFVKAESSNDLFF